MEHVDELRNTMSKVLKLQAAMNPMDCHHLNEMKINWWQPNNTELHHFQGYKAVKQTVKEVISGWEDPIKDFIKSLETAYLENIVKQNFLQSRVKAIEDSGGAKPSAEAIKIIQEKWELLVIQQVKKMKTALVPTGCEFDSDRTFSAIEQAYSTPPTQSARHLHHPRHPTQAHVHDAHATPHMQHAPCPRPLGRPKRAPLRLDGRRDAPWRHAARAQGDPRQRFARQYSRRVRRYVPPLRTHHAS